MYNYNVTEIRPTRINELREIILFLVKVDLSA